MRQVATLALLLVALATGCGDDGAAAGDDSHGKPGEDLTHTGPAEQAVAGEE